MQHITMLENNGTQINYDFLEGLPAILNVNLTAHKSFLYLHT